MNATNFSDLQRYLDTTDKSHLIFDFDATLILLLLPWELWGNKIRTKLAKYDTDIWDAWHNKQISISELQNTYVEKYGVEVLQIILKHNEWFESTQLKGWEVHPSLLETIKGLDKKYTKYIWSSNIRETIVKVLEAENAVNEFEAIVSRSDVTYVKPNPEGFYKLYNESLPKSEYLMVGDSISDRDAAKNAGIDYLYIEYFRERM